MMRPQVLEYDPSYVLYGGAVSFLVHVIVFKLVSPVLSSKIPGYKTLTQDEKDEWNDRNISNLNALVSVVLSGYCLWYEEDLYDDKVWYDSYIARLACALVIGYMIADLVCMLLWCKLSPGTIFGYLFHHAATIYAYYFISAYGVLCYFGMLRLIAEASTPAVNNRWFFDTLKFPRTRIPVILNGFFMLLTFFIFRMVTMPIYWYQIWLISGTDEVIALGHIQLIMYIPCFVLDALNIFWFYKMCKGFMKALKGLFSQPVNKDESRKHV